MEFQFECLGLWFLIHKFDMKIVFKVLKSKFSNLKGKAVEVWTKIEILRSVLEVCFGNLCLNYIIPIVLITSQLISILLYNLVFNGTKQ